VCGFGVFNHFGRDLSTQIACLYHFWGLGPGTAARGADDPVGAACEEKRIGNQPSVCFLSLWGIVTAVGIIYQIFLILLGRKLAPTILWEIWPCK
jgi:hypothetical protein